MVVRFHEVTFKRQIARAVTRYGYQKHGAVSDQYAAYPVQPLTGRKVQVKQCGNKRASLYVPVLCHSGSVPDRTD